MEQNKKYEEGADREILFSKTVKAGKRIYYIDVKRSRPGDLYLAVTESKKTVHGEGDEAQVSYEKHKIFLYREDMENFLSALTDAIDYIEDEQGQPEPRPEKDDQIRLDLEF